MPLEQADAAPKAIYPGPRKGPVPVVTRRQNECQPRLVHGIVLLSRSQLSKIPLDLCGRAIMSLNLKVCHLVR